MFLNVSKQFPEYLKSKKKKFPFFANNKLSRFLCSLKPLGVLSPRYQSFRLY